MNAAKHETALRRVAGSNLMRLTKSSCTFLPRHSRSSAFQERFPQPPEPTQTMRKFLLLLIPALIVSSASAQDLSMSPNPTMTPRMRTALDIIKADNVWTLEQQRTICEIPAPPFKETARG